VAQGGAGIDSSVMGAKIRSPIQISAIARHLVSKLVHATTQNVQVGLEDHPNTHTHTTKEGKIKVWSHRLGLGQN
jgi:hypothetical protein